MKIAIYLTTILLIILIGFQNLGERYGSYSILSWCWLFLSLTPIFIRTYFKQLLSKKHLFYLLFLTSVVFIQPLLKIHPIIILAGSLMLIIPFLIFEFKKEKKKSTNTGIKLSEEVKHKCRSLIAENKLDKCFEVLSNEAKVETTKKTIFALKQKWNQNRREKNLSLNSNEWIEVQNSKIIDELLNIIK